MPDDDESPNSSQSSTGPESTSADQNVCSSQPDSSAAPPNSTPADGGQGSSPGDTPIGPPPPPGYVPQSSPDSSPNQSVPEQNFTAAAAGGLAASSAAPELSPPEAPPNFTPGEAANDNAVAEEDAAEAEEAGEAAEIGEAAELGEAAEAGEGLLEAGALVEGGGLVGTLLAPEIVIPLVLLALLLSSDDNPTGANAASEREPEDDFENPVLPCEQYKPVIAGQKYSDQTCTDAELAEITDKISAAKKRLKEMGSPQVPKTSYKDQLANATDDMTRSKILRRQQLLCLKLNEMLQAQKELLELRNEMQERCFKSAKNTDDEEDRDDGHRDQVEGLNKSLKNLLDAIKKNCP